MFGGGVSGKRFDAAEGAGLGVYVTLLREVLESVGKRAVHTADPVLAACEAVMALQQVVSRETDPTDSCVITVGKIAAGTAINVIPDTAQIAGTVRTLSPEHRTRVKAALERRLRGIAHAGGCELGWQWNDLR